jgi:hypothetical protein
MERVRVIEGETPVLLVAPHGPDDTNTDYIVESVAKELGAFAVINKGWRRSKNVDFLKDLANCNDIRHLHRDVVKEEMLHPILRFARRINRKYGEKAFVLLVRGCPDSARQSAEDERLDMIIGDGEGENPSYTCGRKFKNAFAHYLSKYGFSVYRGKAGGKYSARSKNNLNQLFSFWYPDFNVNSLQLEIVRELRCEEELLQITVEGLISAIDNLMLFDDATALESMQIKEI